MIGEEVIHIRVPATTANLGPGFDVLGLALGLWNEVHITPAPTLTITVKGEGKDILPRDERNLVYQAMRHLAEHVGVELPPIALHLYNAIPLQAGLGSSSAAIIGGLLGAARVLGVDLPRAELLRLAVEVEGHPDNVAPALYRGLVAVAVDEHGPIVVRIPIPRDMRVVIVLPDVHVSTKKARALLPNLVPREDAVFNIAHAIFVVQALSRGDYSLLKRTMADRLHEPYRRPLIPAYDAVAKAAKRAGAAAVVISGSGPAMAAFAPQQHTAIAQAMEEAFQDAGLKARSWILPVVPGNGIEGQG